MPIKQPLHDFNYMNERRHLRQVLIKCYTHLIEFNVFFHTRVEMYVFDLKMIASIVSVRDTWAHMHWCLDWIVRKSFCLETES